MTASVWKVKATGGGGDGKAPDLAEARRALAILADPEQGCQLQYNPRWADFRTFAGDDLDGMVSWVAEHADALSIYYALNPVSPQLDHKVKVADPLKRRWLLVDVDRKKTAATLKLSATDEERDAADELAAEIQWFLAEQGWPDPVRIGSGNGTHLLYRIDLANDAEHYRPHQELIANFLRALAATFNGPKGEIGAECHDACRIAKLPGTWARKGPSSPDRPWRLATLDEVPDPIVIVSAAKIQETTARLTQREDPEPPKANPFKARIPSGANGHYGRAALDKECEKMRRTQPGSLNAQLYRSAAALGNLLAGGALKDEEMVVERLLEAGRVAGCNNPGKDESCVRRGIQRGKTTPRTAPEKDQSAAGGGSQPGAQPEAEKETTWVVTYDGESLAEGKKEEVVPVVDEDEHGQRVRCYQLLSMGRIMDTHYPEPNWVVKGLLSEGLNILAGAPKQGKSMLALNLALTVAGGGLALGYEKVTPADVLYLSLEDRERRVQFRARRMLPAIDQVLAESVRRRLTIATDWPRQSDGGLKMLEYWRTRCERPTLVIIDVLNRFCPPQGKGSGSVYGHEADYMSDIKRWSDRHGVTVQILHHTRKPGPMKEIGDFVNEISGTHGIGGSADGIMVLLRHRQNVQANLHVTGRDWGEQELVIEFDPNSFTWKSLGTATEHVKGRVQQAVVAKLKEQNGMSMFVKELANAIGEKEDSVRTACRVLFEARLIRKVGNAYAWPGEGEPVHEDTRAFD